MDVPHLFAGDDLLQTQEKSLAFWVIKAMMMIPRQTTFDSGRTIQLDPGIQDHEYKR
jgi:hypothetical protein